jgi:Methylase involved in ubiquinone/menaquinone biosynthesis
MEVLRSDSLQATRNFFNRVAADWDNMCYHDPEKIEAILKLAGVKKGSRILDIATGTGVMIPYLLKTEPEIVLAIDLSDQMIGQARSKYPQPTVCFQNVDFYNIIDNAFDLAIVYSAYPHFKDKPAFARKLAASLSEGGRFMIAHSESKEVINNRHSGDQVKHVSELLKKADEESAWFEGEFAIDIMVDTDELYIISGIKR